MKELRQTIRKLILSEGLRNTTQAANAIIDVMLDNPDYSMEDAAAEIFWNFEQPSSSRARRFHEASMDRVGEQIQRRLSKTGICPHGGDSEIVHSPEEDALIDLYHDRIPTSQHEDYGFKQADWRKFR